MSALQFVSTAAIFTFVPIIARNFGATDTHISLLTMGNIVVSVLGVLEFCPSDTNLFAYSSQAAPGEDFGSYH